MRGAAPCGMQREASSPALHCASQPGGFCARASGNTVKASRCLRRLISIAPGDGEQTPFAGAMEEMRVSCGFEGAAVPGGIRMGLEALRFSRRQVSRAGRWTAHAEERQAAMMTASCAEGRTERFGAVL